MYGRLVYRVARLVPLVLLWIAHALPAAPIVRDQVPEALRAWIPWVLHGEEQIVCPQSFGEAGVRICAFPTRLDLDLRVTGGTFSYAVTVVGVRSYIVLPGETETWPRDVRVDGAGAALSERDGRPGLWLAPGTHAVSGAFEWPSLPGSLVVPSDAGIVHARVDGRDRALRPDESGRLLLGEGDETAVSEDAMTAKTFRLVDDDVPLRLLTRYDLSVSGSAREIVLPNALLPGFSAVSVESELPARLAADGSLHVQARAGNHAIVVTGRSVAAVGSLALPKSSKDEEVWSYRAHNALRLARVEGVSAVDPRQLPMPADWQAQPAFLMRPGDAMRFVETRRGDPEPAPDKLSLNRSAWLDFDGGGFTLQDRVEGVVSRSSRFEMAAPVTLGSVTLDGVPQLVTRAAPSGPTGIEVRRGPSNIVAVSRVDGPERTLPATGWTSDFDSASVVLHLPPGWRLVHAGGVDDAQSSWVSSWTLWDFFFVLLSTLAAARMYGVIAGAVLGGALALSWHLPDAPQRAWIVLLALDGALRVLPQSRFTRYVKVAKWLCVAATAALLVGFAIDQIRIALYPSLERTGPSDSAFALQGMAPPAAKPAAPALAERAMEARRKAFKMEPAREQAAQDAMESATTVPEVARSSAVAGSAAPAPMTPTQQPDARRDVDPGAKVQTGSGLPAWSWNDHRLSWHGPVQQGQRIDLVLLPPWATKVVTFAMIALLALSLWRCIGTLPPAAGWRRIAASGGSAAVVFWLALALPPDAHARKPIIPPDDAAEQTPAAASDAPAAPPAVPTAPIPKPVAPPGAAPVASDGAESEPQGNGDWAALLRELKRRLELPPDCAPACADIARMLVVADAAEVQLRLEIHAQAATLVALPGDRQQWRPTQATLDGKAAPLVRSADGRLWIAVPIGVHTVELQSPTGDADAVQIALPQRPHVLSSQVSGWTLSGTDARGIPGTAVTLTRAERRESKEKRSDPDTLPPFVVVERSFDLGLDWRVNTLVRRASPSRAPVAARVRLVPGESVTDPAVRVADGFAEVSLGAEESIGFTSTLEQRPQLTLTAADATDQIEWWTVDTSTRWHLVTQGLAPIQTRPDARRIQQWRPWPGEKVTLDLTRPAGVPGQTVTLDVTDLTVTPGLRATDTRASLSLRSSLGGDHTVTIPENATLLGVSIDGMPAPVRASGRKVVLPLHPGTQQVQIEIREPRGIGTRFETPVIDTGTPGANSTIHVNVPRDRITLLLGGPTLGPAVLFWGVLVVLAGAAWVAGRSGFTPLGTFAWFLLGLGMSQSSIGEAVLVAGWFAAMAVRGRVGERAHGGTFNAMQIGLGLLTLVALSALVNALHGGLLGFPDLMIRGNGSTATEMNWYHDRIAGPTPQAWIVTVPLWAYHIAMLAWALWLAAAAIKWVKWGWSCFSAGRLWDEMKLGGDRRWGKPKGPEAGTAEPSRDTSKDAPRGDAVNGGAGPADELPRQ